MKRWSRCRSARGFSLLEVAIALAVMAILAAGLALPLAAQVHMRRIDETRRLLDEARDALLGFAAAHGRLPCPASADSAGLEAFAPGGDASNGLCASFHGGFLPGAALALPALDAHGLVRDAWGSERNRVRYAVAGNAVNGVAQALTRANGLQAASLPGIAAAPHHLFVCSSGAAAGPGDCGPATSQLTRRAAFVLLSTGANGALEPPAGGDEARNLDGDAVFVSREAGPGFDDVVAWGSIHMVGNRLLVAGRLP
jgi:prepilin-type N-terminal cleavage/methylation domain-containing protein